MWSVVDGCDSWCVVCIDGVAGGGVVLTVVVMWCIVVVVVRAVAVV